MSMPSSSEVQTLPSRTSPVTLSIFGRPPGVIFSAERPKRTTRQSISASPRRMPWARYPPPPVIRMFLPAQQAAMLLSSELVKLLGPVAVLCACFARSDKRPNRFDHLLDILFGKFRIHRQ